MKLPYIPAGWPFHAECAGLLTNPTNGRALES